MTNLRNNKLIVNRKMVVVVCVILLFLLVISVTYAFIIIPATVTNGNYTTGSILCFNIDYSVTNDNGTLPITGILFPSSGPSGGLYGKVSININASCNVNGSGTLQLKVNSATDSDTFFQTVGAHCENSKTLKTLTSYTTSSTCTAQTDGIWVTDGTALKYAIYTTSGASGNPVKVGYISEASDVILYDGFSITKTQSNYYIYVWLDGNVSDNSYQSLKFDGYIHASAIQVD